MTDVLRVRILNALTNDTPTASLLTALLAEAAAAVTAGHHAIKQAKEQARDLATPDDDAQHLKIVQLETATDKIEASIPKLQQKLDDATARERYAAWRNRYDELEARRDAISEELKSYPALAGKIADMFARAAVCDEQISALHRDRPSGVSLHLQTAEMKARGMTSFTAEQPAIAKEIRLVEWSDAKRTIWPPPRKIDVSLFAPVVVDRREIDGNWWQVLAEREEKARKVTQARIREEEKRMEQSKRNYEDHLRKHG